MGYVDPQQNIRSYVDVMNRKTREIGDNFNLKFNQMNQQMRSNIARNAKKMQEAKLKKELTMKPPVRNRSRIKYVPSPAGATR